MLPHYLAYALIEFAMALGIAIVAYVTGTVRTFATKRFLLVVLTVSLAWTILDFFAISAQIFEFPSSGSLPLRIFGLPIEEYLFFPLHTSLVWVLLLIGSGNRPRAPQSSTQGTIL